MNIVLYVNSYLPSIGGREIVVHQLARQFKRLGHNVRVVGPAGWWSHRRVSFEYPVHRWPTFRGLFREAVWLMQLRLDIAIWGGDVIHAHSTYPCGYIAAKLNKYRAVPLVITPHGEDIHIIPEIGFGQRLDPEQKPKIQYGLKNAHIITAISNSVTNSLLDADTNPCKIRHIPNGIDLKRFERTIDFKIKEWLGFPPGTRLITTVGNYHPRKGHELLLHSMKQILQKEPSARLVIVGRGTEVLVPLINQLGLQEIAKLTGPIAFPGTLPPPILPGHSKMHDVLAALYQSSDIYVSAAMREGAEGLSLAVLEAMAAGLPVVATDVSGNRDIIKDRKNGYLIPTTCQNHLSVCILKLLRNEEMRQLMGTEAKKIARDYDWNSIANQYIAVYSEPQHNLKCKKERFLKQTQVE